MLIPSLIQHKRDGNPIAAEDWARLVADYTAGEVPDYQMSALLMAVVFRGLARQELAALTDAMLDSGDRLRFDGFPLPRVDKHSTGGVGDKVSLLLAPMVTVAAVSARRSAGDRSGESAADVPLVPVFVVGFLLMVAVTSAGLVPDGLLEPAATVRTILLAAALFSLGASLDLRSLAVTGRQAAAVGLASWVLVAGTSLAGLHLVT